MRYDPIMCMMVDEPTKAQDAKKEEGFKILSATIRGEKLVLTFEDLLNSPGKKETMEFTKKEAEAFKKDPWNTWTGNTKSIVEKFIGGKVHDTTSALDKAIKTADGMFSKAFGEYSKGAKFKKDKFLKELAGIEDAKEFASKMQTFDNELRKNLERLDEAYNVAGQDYYSARNEIRSIMDAFSKEAFGLYRKLDTK